MKPLGLILLAVGGYVLYEYFYGTPATTVVGGSTVQTATPGNTIVNTTTNSQQTSVDPLTYDTSRFNAYLFSIGFTSGNADDLSYHFKNATGKNIDGNQMTGILNSLGDSDRHLTVVSPQAFMSALVSIGYYSSGGLGMIVGRSNWIYGNNPTRQGSFGVARNRHIKMTGFEKLLG